MTRSDSLRSHGLSMASEDYLEAIYRMALQSGDVESANVRSVDVAELLNVSKASVSKALTTLKEAGMVAQMRYGRVQLTPEGRRYARHVWHSHRILRAFLTEELGVDAEVADEEACLMEHSLSDETIEKWCSYLERQGVRVPE